MLISLSVDNIIKTVFAHSAIQKTTDRAPEILTNRHDPALRQLLYHCTCRVATHLIGIAHLTDDNPDMSNFHLIYFETEVNPAEPLGTTLRIFIETALVAAMLAAIWQGNPELSKIYTDVVEQNIKNIQAQYSRSTYRITPSE